MTGLKRKGKDAVLHTITEHIKFFICFALRGSVSEIPPNFLFGSHNFLFGLFDHVFKIQFNLMFEPCNFLFGLFGYI